jgi:CelD/BcsL family acetyltransferase involved in cellulose biosynthesis
MLLEAVDADDAVSAALVTGMQQRGWLIAQRDQPGTSWINLPSRWDEYLATVSKNHRKRCRKWQREFFESGRARVQIATDPQECLSFFERLVLLHNERRQSAGMRGAFEDDRFRSFHQLAIRRLARRGRLQLRLLTVDHELVAVEHLLVDAAAFYAYQSGMSAAGEAVSAGNLSILSLIRDAIEQGRRRVDLLRGTEAYKFSWGAVHRAAPTKVLRRRSVAGLMQSCLDNAVQRARLLKNTSA